MSNQWHQWLISDIIVMWEKLEDYWKTSFQVILCVCLSFVLLRIVKSSSRLLCRIKTLFQSSPSLVDVVKPFVAAVATTINQEQYASS